MAHRLSRRACPKRRRVIASDQHPTPFTPSGDLPVDTRYVAARRVLLDAIDALAPHRRALIVAGAQAVYLRTGLSDIGIAPYTTDGDLALDPALLADEPELETSMRAAGFQLLEPLPGHPEPGVWFATAIVEGAELIIPVDLIVPEAAANSAGRRGARLGPHGNRAARRAVGLEGVLVDHTAMTIGSLDPADPRSTQIEVAGAAALLVAKAHKIHDRLASSRPSRAEDKDAGDVYRLMQTTSPTETGLRLAELRQHPIAGPATEAALGYLADLFQRRNSEGVAMAARALRLAIPEAQIATLATSYIEATLSQIPNRP